MAADASEHRPQARKPRGLIDRRGETLARERAVLASIARVYEAWGFEALDTPALEYADALGKFLPDQDRPNEGVFALEDDDGAWLALRYDLTAPLARFAAEHFDQLPKPYRRWAAGPVWRNEKPGPGRFREFLQCDADSVNAPGAAADAELIAMACEALLAVGLPAGSFRLNINSRRLLNGLLDGVGLAPEDARARLTVLRAADKLDRLGVEGVSALLGAGRKDESGDFTPGAGLAAPAIERVLAFLTAERASRGETLAALADALPAGPETEAGLKDLSEIDTILSALGVSAATINPAVVRGLEYYTGAVFEAELIGGEGGVRMGSVGGGGRYDGLVSRFRGQPVPATGFSIGVSRLVASTLRAETPRPGPVVALALDPARITDAFMLAAELRAAGVRAEAYVGGAGLRAQLKYADRRGAPIAILEGEDERARGVVTLKDLALGAELSQSIASREEWRAERPAQVETPRGEVVAAVQAMLARARP